MGQSQSSQQEPAAAPGAKAGAPTESTPLAGAPGAGPSQPAALPWVGHIVAGVVITIDVIFNWGSLEYVTNYKYAFAVAAVAVIVGSIVYALIKARPDRYDFKVATLTNIGDVSLGTCLASFMMVWWAFAVGILTFWSPYTSIGNGYLAVWLGVVSSAYTLGINRRTNQIYALGPAFGLLASSFVVMLALLPRAYAGTWTRALGLTVSVFSIVAMLAVVLVDQNLLKLPTAPMTRSVLCVVLAISWTVTSLILTYRGPFTSSLSANGYLGSWTGLAFALIYASENVGPLNDKIKYKAKDEEAVSA